MFVPGPPLYRSSVPVLQVTEDAQWLEVFGVLPQPEDVSGDEYVRKASR